MVPTDVIVIFLILNPNPDAASTEKGTDLIFLLNQ